MLMLYLADLLAAEKLYDDARSSYMDGMFASSEEA